MLDQTKYNPISILQSSLTEQTVLVDTPDREDKSAILKSYSTERAAEILGDHHSQIQPLLALRHPHLQPLLDVFVEGDNLHILTGAVQGKRAATLVPLSEERCEKLLKDILPVLSYLHERGITHGNISTDTILFTAQNQPILTDFQAVTELQIAARGDVYIPIRQQLQEIPVANVPSEKQFDLYSLGVTTIYLLTNRELKYLYDGNTQKWQWENQIGVSSSKMLRAIDLLLSNHATSAAEVLQEFQTRSKVILDLPPPNENFNNSSNIYSSNPSTSSHTSPHSTNSAPPHTDFHHSVPTTTQSTQSGNQPLPTLFILVAGVFLGGGMLWLGMSIANNSSNRSPVTILNSSPIAQSPKNIDDLSIASSHNSPLTQTPPENLIAEYYQEINSRQYEAAWNKLPLKIREDRTLHPNGYQSFVDFFNSFSGVRVNNLTASERNDSIAVVNANLDCQLKNGRRSPLFLRFNLNRNSNDQQWKISKIQLDPDRKSLCGTDTDLTTNDAINLITQWLEAKKSLFGSSYLKSAGENLTTGLAYQRNITDNSGTDRSSIDELSKDGMYYTYGNQQVHQISDIRPLSSDEVRVTAIVSEQRTLHNTRTGRNKTSFTNRDKSCYEFKKVGDSWKISKTPELFSSCP